MELGLSSANWALTFFFSTVVTITVSWTEIPGCSLRGGSGTRTALHPGPLSTIADKKYLYIFIITYLHLY